MVLIWIHCFIFIDIFSGLKNAKLFFLNATAPRTAKIRIEPKCVMKASFVINANV